MAILIYHEYNGIKKFVSSLNKTERGYYIFEFTTKEDDAKDFKTVIAATEALSKHVNSYNRKYDILNTSNNKKEALPTGLFINEKKLLR